MPAKLHYRPLLSLAARVAPLAVALWCAQPVVAAPLVDLRRIDPVHGDANAGSQKASVCFACHGENGTPIAPMFPRLAGQRPDYLYHRLVAFHSADPKAPYYSTSPMTPLAAPLTDEDMRNLAVFFAAQTPQAAPAVPASEPPTGGSKATPEKGRQIFMAGDPSRGVPPCQGCHGPDANGSSTRGEQYLVYPSLRGQGDAFLAARLKSFRDGLPHDTSNALIMGGVARNLDDEAIDSLAAWLSSLNPEKALQ